MSEKKQNIHTVPDKNGSGWVNKIDGKVASRHRTQRTATEAGRKQAKKSRSEHYIHRPDGRIRDANSYGDDPYPPKG